ncbi:MAG TPA: hypothetical protein VFO34_00225 [Candidatus Acidoferrales bacterium]|nr:hypothetical protein [Candidatus Acidoferrales bacterium]
MSEPILHSSLGPSDPRLAPRESRRLLVICGISLILAGMIFGDFFAVFILHQNATKINARLLAATQAVAARDAQGVANSFQDVGGFLENRGTKVDAHAHMIAFGYIALLLALLQPFVGLPERTKTSVAKIFLTGSVLLPVGVFLIHYVGLARSPFAAIGWASVVADFGGLLVIVAAAWELVGVWRYWRRGGSARVSDDLPAGNSWCERVLLCGGTLLILIGFLHGAYYAGVHLYANEAADRSLLSAMVVSAASGSAADTAQALGDYAQLQGAKAVNVAAHAHIIEFGLLAILMALFQPYVSVSERWRRIWAAVLLAGSLILPVFVLLEMQMGLVAGGIADVGGLLVVIALFGMLFGMFQRSERLDTTSKVRT